MSSVTQNHYECIVIGGGVAGATAAYYLAQLGYQTAVLERTTGPHHKVCGEFLSFEAVLLLQDMGIGLDAQSPQVKHFRLFTPLTCAHFTFPAAGRGLSRYKLDEKLLNNAAREGAAIHRGVCMQAYVREDNGVYKITTNKGDFHARHLFMATGKHDHDKPHKRMGWDNAYLGFKTHLRLYALNNQYKETTALFSFPGGYGGICPVEEGSMNFCFVIHRKLYKSLDADLNRVISYLSRRNAALKQVLQEARFVEPISAVGHIPYGFLRPPSRPNGVIFLGDQRMVIPSLTGDGMAIALSTAKRSVAGFHRQQQGMPSEADQSILENQMRWAFAGHAILKYHWAADFCGFIPGLSHSLISSIFKKTRIKDIEPEAKDIGRTEHYSRC